LKSTLENQSSEISVLLKAVEYYDNTPALYEIPTEVRLVELI
jgi:hypothetical protein